MDASYVPYCGPAPVPDQLWSSWNLDPWLLPAAAIALAFCLCVSANRPATAPRVPLGLGIAVLAIAFVSPLCALSSALFSARIVHHMLLVAVVAPLLALAFPERAGLRRVPAGVLFALHTGFIWLWHAPAPYAFALESHAAYWLMEATLFASALMLWQRMLSPRTNAGQALALLLGTTIQMGMLGALLTFAGRPLFEHHLTTTLPFGLTPLADQQLAGLIMWVPAALPYVAAAIVIAFRLLGASEGDRRRTGAAA